MRHTTPLLAAPTAAALAALAALAAPRTADAGLLDRQFDAISVTPYVGTHALWRASTANSESGVSFSMHQTDPTLVVGLLGAVRLGPIEFGALVQRTQLADPDYGVRTFDQFSAHVGVNAQLGPTVLQLSFRGGMAYRMYGSARDEGYSGGLSVAYDVYPLRVISLGVAGTVDAQLYSTDAGLDVLAGLSVVGRIGLHL